MTATATAATTRTETLSTSVDPVVGPVAPAGPRRRIWRVGVASGALAAAATTVAAAVARAADVPLAIDGEEIPLLGFAQLTMLGAVLGIVIAKACARWVRNPRRTFVRTAVALTALSIVPDVTVDATTGSKLVLAATHALAAAIVVPAMADRLPRTGG